MHNEENDKAPFFKSWTTWYVLVIAVLAVLIIAFYFFTRHFQ